MQQSEDYYTLGKVVSRKLSKISVDSQVQNGGQNFYMTSIRNEKEYSLHEFHFTQLSLHSASVFTFNGILIRPHNLKKMSCVNPIFTLKKQLQKAIHKCLLLQYWNENLTLMQAVVKVTFPYRKDTLHEGFCSCFVLYFHLLTRNWLWICFGTWNRW